MTVKRTIILILFLVVVGAAAFFIIYQARANGLASNGLTTKKLLWGPKLPAVLLLDSVIIEKKIEYQSPYTLQDVYPYRDTIRRFQWEKINRNLTFLQNLERNGVRWGMLRNYKNYNGRPPRLAKLKLNEYKSYVDDYGVEQGQASPLYDSVGSKTPVRYGRDGVLVRYIKDSANYVWVSPINEDVVYIVPAVYFMAMKKDTINKVVAVDRSNQNIATLLRDGDSWQVLSMTYATTGEYDPPYQRDTPIGIYVVQDYREKMYYTHDGSSVIAGYAPYATRFTRGAYVHGVPLTNPNATRLIEFSSSLGTVPRSHMCVRTVTSHAKYIYDWSEAYSTLVMVFD